MRKKEIGILLLVSTFVAPLSTVYGAEGDGDAGCGIVYDYKVGATWYHAGSLPGTYSDAVGHANLDDLHSGQVLDVADDHYSWGFRVHQSC